jgi:hypothetical protein
MAGARKASARRQGDIVRDLRAERERFIAVLDDLGGDVAGAVDDARARALKAKARARSAAPKAGAAAAALLLAAMLLRRRRDGRH